MTVTAIESRIWQRFSNDTDGVNVVWRTPRTEKVRRIHRITDEIFGEHFSSIESLRAKPGTWKAIFFFFFLIHARACDCIEEHRPSPREIWASRVEKWIGWKINNTRNINVLLVIIINTRVGRSIAMRRSAFSMFHAKVIYQLMNFLRINNQFIRALRTNRCRGKT